MSLKRDDDDAKPIMLTFSRSGKVDFLSQSHSSEKEPHKPPRLHKVHSPVETRWSFLSAVRASILKV